MRMILGLIQAVVFVSIGLVTGCRDDFLYITKNQPALNQISQVYQIKDISKDNLLDIIWIIDNSGSMGTHQQAVIRNADLFMNKFVTEANVEWRMGLLSTDDSDGPYLGFRPHDRLEYNTPNPVGIFRSAVGRLGTYGSPTEKIFDPLREALDTYPDFLRTKSHLALILLTDTDDQSRSITHGVDFLNWLKKTKGDNKIGAHGVFAFRGSGCTGEGHDWANSRLKVFMDAIAGKDFTLCDANFGQNLATIGKEIVSKVRRSRIYLPEAPLLSTLQVFYQGAELKGGEEEAGGIWFYETEENAVVFYNLNFAPSDSETVEVRYSKRPSK